MAKGLPGFKTLKFTAGSTPFTGIFDFSGGLSKSVEQIIISNATYEDTAMVAQDVYAGELNAGTFTLSFIYSGSLLTGLNAQLGVEQALSLSIADGKTIGMRGFIASISTPYPLKDKILIDVEVAYGGNVTIS